MTSPVVRMYKDGGQLLSLTMRIQDADEQKIFKALIDDDVTACPHCGDPIKVGEDDMMITFDNPLSPPAFMKLATPSIICDKCKREINLSMVDYTPFAKEEKFLVNLREEYKKRKGLK